MAAVSPDRPPLAILLLGASGLIGADIGRILLADGHSIVGVARNVATAARRQPAITWHSLDIAQLRRPEDWAGLLDGVDMVVNAAGALQDGPADDTRTLQVNAMTALFFACAQRQRALVHISAAGVDSAIAPFMRQKHEADGVLQGLDFPWIILRPGLVLSPVAYGGSAMLRALASMPIVVPVTFADRILRCVNVADIANAVRTVVEGGVEQRRTYDLVSDKPETFTDLLSSLRAWLGLPKAPVLRLPPALVRPIFALGDLVGWMGWRTPMRSATFNQLSGGVDGDPVPWREATGGSLPGSADILASMPAGVQERWFARLWLLKPVTFVTLSAFWLLSGLIGSLRWEVAADILAGRGMSTGLAVTAVLVGSAADITIGLAIAFRRTSRAGLLAALAVSVAYLLGSALLAADLWLDPLGPMLKVFPAIVLTFVALAILEDR
jgi:uncharacterized protein YbjT (DUF2867 family)